jgi:hypothetical protein
MATQLNWVLAHPTTAPWRFILDSDEVPMFGSQQLLRILQAAEDQGKDAITLRRRNIVWGRWVKHGGWYPDVQVRVVRTSAQLSYEPIPVHQRVDVPRHQIYFSNLELRHDTYETVDDYWGAFSSYTTWEAQIVYRLRGRSARPTAGSLKMLSRVLPARFWVHLAYRYILRLGFLDGWRGWHLALWSAVYQDAAQAKRRYGG